VAHKEGSGERPFPPGDYPLVVVGSGPGALQFTYSLTRLGVPHAVISADPAPGGMFRRWPFFQRLLSWTKPFAPAQHDSRTYERYDWNSLIPEEPELRAIQPTLMDGSSYFPARREMEQNLVTFYERAGLQIRFGCRWTGTRREETADGVRFALETTDGEYRAPIVVFAVGIAEPWSPPTPGIELSHHYAETRSPETYAGHKIFIIGKSVSAFELATGLLQWARQLVLASPSSAKLSVNTRSLVGVRARYVQPYEDYVLGGGVSLIDGSIDEISRTDDGTLLIRARHTEGGGSISVEADDVINATGFVCPLLDLSSLGVQTFGQSRVPAQTPFWESVSLPGIHFAGTIGQGSVGLKKHGLPSNSGAVHGARYNARVLARHLAATRFGVEPVRTQIRPGDLVDFCLGEIADCAELWHQKAYLARVVTANPGRGLLDEGVQPLAHVLDAGGDDAIILTLEADGTGAIYPVVYLRRDGAIAEHAFEPDPLLDYAGEATRQHLAEIVRTIVPDA
jgi:thioredoxin reductase